MPLNYLFKGKSYIYRVSEFQSIFHYPKKKQSPLAITSPNLLNYSSTPTNPRQLLNLFSVSIDLTLWMFHINRIKQYMVLHDWFVSVSIWWHTSVLPFYCQVMFHCMNRSHLIYLSISWWAFGLFAFVTDFHIKVYVWT
jgi:hypothetical protein